MLIHVMYYMVMSVTSHAHACYMLYGHECYMLYGHGCYIPSLLSCLLEAGHTQVGGLMAQGQGPRRSPSGVSTFFVLSSRFLLYLLVQLSHGLCVSKSPPLKLSLQ